MTIKRNKIPTRESFDEDYTYLKIASEDIHSKITRDLYSASMSYQESSALEDVVLEDFLALYTEAKNVSFVNKGKNTVFESFLTTRYSDPSFPIKKRLNIDTQNGDLVLPLLSSTSLKVEAITFETDSNGSIGDSILNDDTNDINTILSQSSSSLFKYDKIASKLDSNNLVLALNFKLASVEILNAIFIKLFTSDNGIYPEIENVETSADGVTWTPVNINYTLNKSDFYLRFYPVKAQFIRVRFIQKTFNSIKTLFGYKYQYMIGIREISFKQDEYDKFGEYVSIPFSTGKSINTATFNFTDFSNNDVKYMISANGGGKWLNVERKNQTLQMIDLNTGVLNSTDIKDLRVKIAIDKTSSELNLKQTHEFYKYNSTNKYYMKQSPKGTYVSCGKHFSFGGEYFEETLTNRETKSVLLKGLYQKIASLKGLAGDDLLVVEINNNYISPMNYTIEEDSNTQNALLKFNSPVASGSFIKIWLKPFLYTSPLKNKIELPARSFYDDKYEFFITEYVGSPAPTGGNVLSGGRILDFTEFNVSSKVEFDQTIIEILNSTFKKNAIYEIKYTPCMLLQNTIVIDENEIEIASLNLNDGTELRFDYIYNGSFDVSLEKFYTPIINEYTVEII